MYALRGVELTGTNTPRPFPRFSVFLHIVKESDSWGYMNWIPGGHSGGVTPGSMPNPAVKPSSADGTAEAIRGRVGRCRKSFFYVFRIETDHRNRPLRSGEFPATAGDSPLFSCVRPRDDTILSSRTSRLCLSSRTSGATEGPAFEFGLHFFVILRSGFGDEGSAPDFGFVNCEIPRP